ncbi:MAG: O-antigen ligase family protein [Deltaproteobacteria bacterium]|nr:O-antigen ligase family protein [Deltaproteobacteria bacterium]
MLVFVIANLRHKVDIRNYDYKLTAVVLLFGSFLFIYDAVLSVNEGQKFFSFLVSKGSFLVPYAWFFFAAPVIARLKTGEKLLLSIAAGTLLVITWHILRFDFLHLGMESSDEIWAKNREDVGALKNAVALIAVIALFILLCWNEKRVVLGRYLKAVGITLAALGLLLLFSRSSYLTAIICGLYYYRRRISRRTVIVLVVLAIGVYFIPDAVWDRISYTWTSGGHGRGLDESSETRVYLWLAAISAFAEHPFFGIGLRSLPDYLPFFSNYFQLGNTFHLMYAHNFILTMFGLTGIAGGILAINLFWQGFKAGGRAVMRGEKTGEVVQLLVLAFLVSSQFGEPLIERSSLIVFLIVLSTVAYRAEESARR